MSTYYYSTGTMYYDNYYTGTASSTTTPTTYTIPITTYSAPQAWYVPQTYSIPPELFAQKCRKIASGQTISLAKLDYSKSLIDFIKEKTEEYSGHQKYEFAIFLKELPWSITIIKNTIPQIALLGFKTEIINNKYLIVKWN